MSTEKNDWEDIIHDALRPGSGSKEIKTDENLDVSREKKKWLINQYRIRRFTNWLSFAIKLVCAVMFIWKIAIQPFWEFKHKMCIWKSYDIIDKLIDKIVGIDDWKLAFVLCSTLCFVYYIRKKYPNSSVPL